MQVYINKDIREYQVKDIGPFTLRQAIFSILAVASIFVSRAIQRALFGTYISLLLYLPAVPFLLFGFGSSLSIFGGLPFEKWLKSVFVENFLNPKNRPFCYEMTWDVNDILTEDELKIYHQMETEKVTVLPDVTESMAKEFYAEQNAEDTDIQKVYEGIVNADNGSKTAETITEESDEETYGIYYTKADNSVFKHLDSVNPEWTKAAENFQSIIEYKDHVLSVSVKNNLTGEMESFSVKENTQEETTDETLQGLSGGGDPE